MKTENTELSQPWMQRTDWAAGEVKSSDKKKLAGLWLFAIFWNAIAMPVAFLLPRKIQQSGDGILFVFFLFPVIGILMITVAIRSTFRLQKFGTSRFKMLSVPGVIGGSLSGIIQTNRKIHPENGFALALQCVQMVTTGTGKNRRTEEHVLWEDKKVVTQLDASDMGRSGIPVFFQIPEHCSATSTAQRISWKLKADAAVEGIDFHTEFEVPVFEVSGQKQSAVDPAQFANRFEIPIDYAAALAAAGISMQRGADGMEIYLPAARNKGMGLSSLLFLLIAATGLTFAIVKSAPALVIFVAAAFTGVLAVVVIEMWFKSVRVQAGAAGLTVWTKHFGEPKPLKLAAEEIAGFEVKQGAQAGTTVYYDVKALTRRKAFTLASMIRGRKEADWLAHEIKSSLGWKPTHDEADQTTNN